MSYAVKEIYHTLQGEGFHSGRSAVFCRFKGCNLWSGKEEHRANAICKFCDTDFVGADGPGGGTFPNSVALADAVETCWRTNCGEDLEKAMVVFTGGEPLLQLDQDLVAEVSRRGFYVAVETNGTLLPPVGLDWVCVSPKSGSQFILNKGNELKLVYPQPGLLPGEVEDLRFDHFFLQPMDGPNLQENRVRALSFCLKNPKWRLSLQMHKIMEIR